MKTSVILSASGRRTDIRRGTEFRSEGGHTVSGQAPMPFVRYSRVLRTISSPSKMTTHAAHVGSVAKQISFEHPASDVNANHVARAI
jgi:hypothetical protein